MSNLTEKQQNIYNFIKETIENTGVPPTIREIGEAFGLTSTATVYNHLKRMEEKGIIYKDTSYGRGVYTLKEEALCL